MMGQIFTTDGRGGRVQGDDGRRMRFAWNECPRLDRYGVGHDSRVVYAVVEERGKARAIDVRQAE